MARVLILGADGAIGRHTAGVLADRGTEVIGTTRRAETVGPGRVHADLGATDFDPDALPGADAVIICAAMARFADCREQPELSHRINVEAPAAVARRFAREGARTLYLSTSAVFDGTSPKREADARMAPMSAYGQVKAEGERAVLEAGQGAASVLRLTKVFSPGMALIENWIESLREGRSVKAFTDMTASPIALSDVEAALTAVLADKSDGRYQVSGADDLAYHEIALHLARCQGRSEALVEASHSSEAGLPANEVMRYTSLDTTRLETLTGWRPPRGLDVIDRVFGSQLRIEPT